MFQITFCCPPPPTTGDEGDGEKAGDGEEGERAGNQGERIMMESGSIEKARDEGDVDKEGSEGSEGKEGKEVKEGGVDVKLRGLTSEGLRTGTTDGAPKTEPASAVDVQAAVNTIAAALIFNGLNPEDGYDAFDADEDGQVSLKDLQNAVKTLSLEIAEEDSKRLFETLDTGKNGFIAREAWVEAMSDANTEDVLKSRKAILSDAAPETSQPAASQPGQTSVQSSIDVVAASPAF